MVKYVVKSLKHNLTYNQSSPVAIEHNEDNEILNEVLQSKPKDKGSKTAFFSMILRPMTLFKKKQEKQQ